MKINAEKLSFIGSMNYIVQVWNEEGTDVVTVDQYQPRKNKIWTSEMTLEEVKPQIEETIERMKIAIQHFQEFLDGKRSNVYYWELEDEPWNRKD